MNELKQKNTNIPDTEQPTDVDGQNIRERRAIVFRPKFVYRQEQREKRRISDRRNYETKQIRESRRQGVPKSRASYESPN